MKNNITDDLITNVNMESFLQYLSDSIINNEFEKLTLSKPRKKNSDLLNIYIRKIEVKDENKLSFTYHYKTSDITKNYDFREGKNEIMSLLSQIFFISNLFTSIFHIEFKQTKKGNSQLAKYPPTQIQATNKSHDRVKKRYIPLENNIYLKEFGIISSGNTLKKDKYDKYKQIEKYIDIIQSLIKQSTYEINNIYDMGSGKGYLTFSLYDFLVHTLNLNVNITGIEQRDNLVKFCNDLAKKCSFQHLRFSRGQIIDSKLVNIDMLIALHACDTATDDAIFNGIQSNAKIIIVAPCCQKQLRKELNVSSDFKPLMKHGIFEERMSAILTDGIRALLLEAFGYQTKVFEFISSEHTPKNIMITAIKRKGSHSNKQQKIEEIAQLKKHFGVKTHYLESLLNPTWSNQNQTD